MNINHSLRVFFVDMYNNAKGENRVSYVPTLVVAKKVMLPLYYDLLKDGTVTMIELLPKEEKEKLVSECRVINTEFSNETLSDSCRILHLIKTINSYT